MDGWMTVRSGVRHLIPLRANVCIFDFSFIHSIVELLS